MSILILGVATGIVLAILIGATIAFPTLLTLSGIIGSFIILAFASALAERKPLRARRKRRIHRDHRRAA